MSELYYIAGRFLAPDETDVISGHDRGYNFGDGVYEVIRVYSGRPFTLNEHLTRLERSAAGIDLTPGLTRRQYELLCEELIARSGLKEAMIYIQLTRGVLERNHLYLDDLAPSDYCFIRALDTPAIRARLQVGYRMISVEDDRWNHCDIKAISLLPNILAKNRARKQGAGEAIYYDPETRLVSEGSASNVFAVKDGVVYTAPDGPKVLSGVTRDAIFQVAETLGIEVRREAQTLDFFREADEVVAASATMEIMPVRAIDNIALKRSGEVGHGPIFTRIFAGFLREIEFQCESFEEDGINHTNDWSDVG